jgi:hypothetical protein
VQRELVGVDWRWRNGSKHWHLLIGDDLAAIWPHGKAGESSRIVRDVITSIRRVRGK